MTRAWLSLLTGPVFWSLCGLLSVLSSSFLSPSVLANSVHSGSSPEPIRLTPQLVVDRVLNLGLQRQVLDANLVSAELPIFQAKAAYDFRLMAETNYEVNRGDTMNVIANNEEDKNFSALLGLSKQLGSGTDLRINYRRSSVASLLNPFAQNQGFPSTRTLDSFSLELEQDLLKNAFGRDQRLQVKTAQKSYLRAQKERMEGLEDVVLEAMEHFWHSYVAQENLRESVESRDRYSRLVANVRDKARLGFAAPGELASAQAELELQQQRVKQASLQYLNHVDQLLRLLRLDYHTEVEFQIEEILPALPEFSELSLEEMEGLRSLQVARSQVKEQHQIVNLTQSSHRPQLSLIARITQTGAEEEPTQALSKMLDGSRPIYFIGLKLTHPLDSSLRRGDILAARAELQRREVLLEKVRDSVNNQLRQAKREINALYLIAESSLKSVELWKQAAREIDNSYRQGRTDISEVVRIYNSLQAAETQRTRAIGDYHIALNRLAALRDELVGVSP